MAIYFPDLYCSKGTILEVIEEIRFEKRIIDKGQKCYVYNIVGYGFDIFSLWDNSNLFRVINSQMRNYFEILISPKIEELNMNFSVNKAVFIADFEVDDYVIKEGETFYFTKDKCRQERGEKIFYDLYNKHRKVLRLSEIEMNKFVKFVI